MLAITRLRLPHLLLLAGLALGAAYARPARAGQQPRIEDVEESLAHDRSYKVRVSAALILGRLHQTRSIPALISACKDPQPAVRASAVHALGRIGSPIGRDAVVKATQDPVPAVRHVAREALKLFDRGEATAAAPPPPPPATEGRRGTPAIRARAGNRLLLEVKPMGDTSRHAGPALRSHMRDFLVDQLRPVGDPAAREHEGAFAIDGIIKDLTMGSHGPDVQISCAVQLVVSRQPGGGVFLLTSGEATVLKPRRQWKPQQRAGMELEALESAVRAASEDLVRQLASL